MFYFYFKLLKQRNFFLLLFGQIISQFGDKLTQIALIGLVSRLSSSSWSLATTISMTVIPVIVFSPVCGVYVDRWSKRKTMYICELLRGLCTLLIIVSIVRFPFLPVIYAIVFISFSIGRFFVPAKMAILPQIVKKDEIFLANSLISITAVISAIFGIGLGSIIIERYGLEFAFFIDILTFFISAVTIFFIFVKEKSKFLTDDIINISKAVTKTVKNSFAKELKEGIRYIYQSEETKYALIILLFLFGSIGIFPVFTKFIQNALGSLTKDIGFVGISLGVGIFFGSLIYGRIAHIFSVKNILNFSILISSIYIIIFSIFINKFPSTFLAILLSFFLGFILSPLFTGIVGLIHRESSYNFLGRIFSGLEFISHLSLLISMFIFAFLADLFSPFTVIIWFGIISSFVAIVFISYGIITRAQRTKA